MTLTCDLDITVKRILSHSSVPDEQNISKFLHKPT